MIPATTNGGGQCFAFPDVCKTPSPGGPVPIPYPNIAMCTDLNTGTCPSKIRICKKFAATVQSKIPLSSGDEPGTAGGVVSGCNKGEAVYVSGYPKVMLQGKVAAFLTSVTTQNKVNIVGAQVAPSQTKVLFNPAPVMGSGQRVSGSASSTVEQLRELVQDEYQPAGVRINLQVDGQPLANEPVDLIDEQGRTYRLRADADGTCLAEDLPPGRYTIRYRDADPDVLE